LRHLTRLVYCGAGAAIIMLAGCSGSGGGTTTPPIGNAVQQDSVGMRPTSGPSRIDLIRREFPLLAAQGSRVPVKAFVNSEALGKQSTIIAVADALNNVVNIYDPAGDELAQLTGLDSPAGMASDSKGNLYVADGNNDRVQIYAAGFTAPPSSLSTSPYSPEGVDSFNNGQIVAVATSYGLTANVQFFTNGQLTNTVSASANFPGLYDCAFDAVGNLYVIDLTESYKPSYGVGEIIGGAHGNKITQLTSSNVLAGALGIQVTTNGQIAVLTDGFDGSHKGVYTYNPPVGSSLGSPVFTTPLGSALYPDAFAFTKNMTSFYVATNDNGKVQQYTYPAGGKAQSTIDVGGVPDGIAVIPTQIPKGQK